MKVKSYYLVVLEYSMFGVRVRSIIIICFILVVLVTPVYSQVVQRIGNYTVYQGSYLDNNTSMGPVYTGGAQNTVNFWDLPLWIQESAVISGLIALLLSLPFIFGVIKKLRSRSKVLLENPQRNTIYRMCRRIPAFIWRASSPRLK